MKIFGTGESPPPAPDDEVYDIVYPRPGKVMDVVFLADSFFGLKTHWWPATERTPARSRLHNEREECAGCRKGLAIGWAGYCPCWVYGHRRCSIISLSERGVAAVCALISDAAELMSCRVLLTRETNHPSSVVRAELKELGWRAGKMPRPDIYPTLRAVYGDDERLTPVWGETRL